MGDSHAEVPQGVGEMPVRTEQHAPVPMEAASQQSPEPPPQISEADAAQQQAQMARLQEIFKAAQEQQAQAPVAAAAETPAPVTLAPTPAIKAAVGGADSLKNFFAKLQLGKMGDVVKKIIQAPGKILSAVGRGIVKFWTAGDSPAKS